MLDRSISVTPGDDIVDAPAPVEPIRPADIFPLRRYRPGQQEAIEAINAAVEARENAILSAGTGTGKTITALTAALPPVLNAKDVRCIFVARTYKENERVLEECMKVVAFIRQTLGRKDFFVLQLKGRARMCLHGRIAPEDKKDPETHGKKCLKLRKAGKCPYYEPFASLEGEVLVERNVDGEYFPILPSVVKDFIKSESGGVYDSERLIAFGQKNRACPYFVAKYLLHRVHLVTCNYTWLFHPAINATLFRGTPFALEQVICVVDEVHNLYDHCCKILSRSISPDVLEKIHSEFEEREKYLTERRKILVEKARGNPVLPGALEKFFEGLQASSHRGADAIKHTRDALTDLVNAHVKTFEQQPLNTSTKFQRNRWNRGGEIELPLSLEETLTAVGDLSHLGDDYALMFDDTEKRFLQYIPAGAPIPPDVMSAILSDGLFHEREPPLRDPTDAILNFANDLKAKAMEMQAATGFLKEFGKRSFFTKFDAQKEPLATGSRTKYRLTSSVFDARLVTLRVFDQAYSVVGMTGSFRESLIRLLGFDASMKPHHIHQVPPNSALAKNIQVIIDTTCSSKYEQREASRACFARQIRAYIELVPGNVGVFCPSYAFARSLRSTLGMYVGHKPVFLETTDSEESTNLLKSFKQRAKKGGAVIIGPCQGKFAEGEDYPGHEMDAAIVAGFPQSAGSPSGEAQQRFYTALFSPKPWDLSPEGQVFSRVIQVAGRPIRNEHDLALIVLMEPRFDRAIFRNEYPLTWHENRILAVTREGDLLKIKPAIQRFFEKFVIKGQVLLDQVEQDPSDPELVETFCRYFEVYLQDMETYVRDSRVGRLHKTYKRIKSRGENGDLMESPW